jgi:hypothetical protein
MAALCKFEGCDGKSYSRGWCNAHYMQWYKGRELTPVVRRRRIPVEKVEPGSTRACTVEGCVRVRRARGLCGAHHEQQRRGIPFRDVRELGKDCTYPGCDRPARGHGSCSQHKAALIRAGKHPAPGHEYRMVRRDGYAWVYVPLSPYSGQNGWVAEHTKVMSDHLGRKLAADENVHHKNGQKADNRLSNLELWVHSQPKGQRVEDKVEFAVEILRRYQPALLRETELGTDGGGLSDEVQVEVIRGPEAGPETPPAAPAPEDDQEQPEDE